MKKAQLGSQKKLAGGSLPGCKGGSTDLQLEDFGDKA
jgi:hypothetical protein